MVLWSASSWMLADDVLAVESAAKLSGEFLGELPGMGGRPLSLLVATFAGNCFLV